MKKLFRFLSAEASNGVYLSALNGFLNDKIQEFFDEFDYAKRVQVKQPEDVTDGELPIRSEDLRGIGKIAGIFPFIVSAESNIGSIVFTPSTILDGKERSERGLFNTVSEMFEFYHTAVDDYPTDIVSFATETLRSSLVPHGAPILGYIAEGTTVLTEDGQIIESNILSSPPVGVAYYPYYGKEYLFMAETFLISTYIDDATYQKVLEICQTIRREGPSIKAVSDLTTALMEDYAYDLEFVPSGLGITMNYKLNASSSLAGKAKRQLSWLMLMTQKFKQIIPTEVTP